MFKVKNLNSFNRAVQTIAARLPYEQQGLFLRKLGLQALRSIVLLTPVDTGRARNSWQVGVNSVNESTAEGNAFERGSSVIAQARPFDLIWISNNVDYIEDLENGSSKKAPNGMVALTLAKLESQF